METLAPSSIVFTKGAVVSAKDHDGKFRKASIIHTRTSKTSDLAIPHNMEYYVHYEDFNRRMDCWISHDDVLPLEIQEDEPIEIEERGVHMKTRKTGRDEELVQMLEPDHLECGMDEESLKEHEEATKFKNIEFIEIGRFKMETWYFSPFPREYYPADYPESAQECLFFCEFCLNFFKERCELVHHRSHCTMRHPPGDEIYRGSDNISMFEVDGRRAIQWCQNLGFIAKLFLDHKTLYNDLEPFLFYVLCECDAKGYHIVGYFSKEKYSERGYNLSCILTFPCYQRAGYGRFLIDFSYMLSKKEKKYGHPEKPLSDLGFLSYSRYWEYVILNELQKVGSEEMISVADLTCRTSIRPEDVIQALQSLDILKVCNGQPYISATPDVFMKFQSRMKQKGPRLDPDKLIWAPFVVSDDCSLQEFLKKASHPVP